MTEENTVVETGDAAPEDNAPPARDYEAEARASGWVPEAEFKGDKKPAQFLDAETFVKRGEELTPFIRKENQRLKEEIARKDSDYAKRFERLERVSTTALDAQKRAHEAEINRVRGEMRAAVESGDTKEFDRLEKVRDGLEKSVPKSEEPVDPKADLATRQAKWRADNTWFDEDFDLQDWAVRYSNFHGEKHPNLSFEDNMAAVTAEAKKRFPEKFGLKKGNGQSAVDPGSDFSGVFKSKGKGEADLPAEARSAGQRYVQQGLYKDMKAYAKVYFEEN